MRAKIRIETAMTNEELLAQVALLDASVLAYPTFSDSDTRGNEIYSRVIETVAQVDRKAAEDGALFCFELSRHGSQGLVSIEDSTLVIRVVNEVIESLKLTCERIVRHLGVYCAQTKKQIRFGQKITILEWRRRNPIIDGEVLVLLRDKVKKTYDDRRIESWIVLLGLLVLALLIFIAAYAAASPAPLPPYTCSQKDGEWLCSPAYSVPSGSLMRYGDIATRFMGAVSVTVFVSGIGILTTFFHIRKYSVKWTVPEGEDS